MSDMKITRQVLFAQHGKFVPDGGTEEIEFGSVISVDPEVTDTEGSFGNKTVKYKIVASERPSVLRAFRDAGGAGEYELHLVVVGTGVQVEKLVRSGKSQGKVA